MKRTRKITSIILAALMVLSALVVSAGGVSAAAASDVYKRQTQSTDGRMFMFTHTAQRKMPNGRESL